ncbi:MULTISPECIES: heavy-metal-associated domain-containing protein [unclassified Lacinutrix]
MKKTIALLVLLFVGTATFAQNKNAKASIEVDGVCGMCKDRIEKACFKIKGVKSAIWSVETHELQLIYNEEKTNLNAIHTGIAAVGHDTKDLKATDEAYATVHPCCEYRDEEVKDDHKE